MVQNGTISEEKTEATSHFSETLTILEILSPTPVYVKLPKWYRLVLTKRYRFGSLTVFLPQFFLDQDGNLQAKGCYEIETYMRSG